MALADLHPTKCLLGRKNPSSTPMNKHQIKKRNRFHISFLISNRIFNAIATALSDNHLIPSAWSLAWLIQPFAGMRQHTCINKLLSETHPNLSIATADLDFAREVVS